LQGILAADRMAAAIAAPGPSQVPSPTDTHGVESYYQQKLDEIDLSIRERTENLQRLRAQRNELNSKGEEVALACPH